MTYSLFDRKPGVLGRRSPAERSRAAPIARAVVALLIGAVGAASSPATAARKVAGSSCPDAEAGLQLPAGFCATVFADHIGHARHLAVSAAGVVYVNTWSGVYFGNAPVPAGGFLVALKDSKGNGHADKIERFGPTAQEGGKGGTGIAIYRGGLYAEEADRIVRYALTADALAPRGPAQTVVEGLPLTGNHPMHPFLIDGKGSLYLDSASATNACQRQDRQLESPGVEPCDELRSRGGIWRYDANKTGQHFSERERYATGLRNAEGFALDRHGRIFVTQHGRDQLHSNWPAIYTLEQEATLPAEELLLLRSGGDYGWPKCYFDPVQKKRVQAPEYGGDGHRIGDCADKLPPVAYFPAHWGPNGMVYYDHAAFPARLRRGVFIAFHGSWNRAPFQQDGYRVVFQGLDGEKAMRCEVFADGFAGANKSPGGAAHRPSGLAVGPDGALFIADDVTGRIYRITYHGAANAAQASSTACPSAEAPAGPMAMQPGADTGSAVTMPIPDMEHLPLPRGASREALVRGERIFRGADGGAACTGCHGETGGGTPLGPNLLANRWLWSDGSQAGIAATIRIGVPQPRNYRSPMPAMGGARLSAEQVSDVAAYVWAIGHAAGASPTAARIEMQDLFKPLEERKPPTPLHAIAVNLIAR